MPAELYAPAREQLALYESVEIRDVEATDARADGDFVIATGDGADIRARTVVLATGVAAACNEGRFVASVDDGEHLFEVQATSPEGAVEERPVRVRFVVDTTMRLAITRAGKRLTGLHMTVNCGGEPCSGTVAGRAIVRRRFGNPGSSRRAFRLRTAQFSTDRSGVVGVRARLVRQRRSLRRIRALRKTGRIRPSLQLVVKAHATDRLGNTASRTARWRVRP